MTGAVIMDSLDAMPNADDTTAAAVHVLDCVEVAARIAA